MRRSVIALSIGFASLLPHALATEFAVTNSQQVSDR